MGTLDGIYVHHKECLLSVVIIMVHALKKLTFYGRTTFTATGVLRLRLRAYDAYGYGRTWSKATGVLRLQLRAYYAYGYGRTTLTATGVLCLRHRAYYAYDYGRTTLTATGVLRFLRLRAYRGYNVLCGRV